MEMLLIFLDLYVAVWQCTVGLCQPCISTELCKGAEGLTTQLRAPYHTSPCALGRMSCHYC